ncbi:MAG: PAS domain S-box protein, partial [Geopsychrobacter sp.]|nr:PAS domain S-box protein [Geopsychrobacter sp.]
MQQQIHEAISRAAKGETVRFETTHHSTNGHLRAIDFSLRPLRNAKNEIIYLIPEGRDISDRKRMERALSRSKERLSTALRAANDGLWDWLIETDDSYFNPTYYTMAGYEPDEFPAAIDEFIKRIHPDDRERVKNDINAHIAGDSSQYRSEFRFKHKNGDWMWILSRGEIIERNKNGTPRRMIGIHSDITSIKENEYQLAKAQSYIRNILDSMPSMLISVDPDGRITQWNLEAEKNTGTSAVDAKGKLLIDVLPQLKNQMEQVKIALKDRRPHRQTKVVGDGENQAHYSDITIYPLIANGIDGAVIRVDDVTERVYLEEMMIQSEKMLSVGGLAAGMAHEINNPLAGILQASQVLLNRLRKDLPKTRKIAQEVGIEPEKIRAYHERLNFEPMLNSIHESGNRAARIVENILNFSRKSDALMHPENLPRLLDKTLELAANDFDLKSRYDFRKIEVVRIYAN